MNRQAELRNLARQMTLAEIGQAIQLLQAELRTRGAASKPVRQPWDRKETR